MFFFPSISLADDVWLLPLSGHLSLCVHTASPQSDSGPVTPTHVALLWPQVNLIVQVCISLRKAAKYILLL